MGDAKRAPVSLMLWRGIRSRCPRCGSKKVFDSWFRLSDRCRGCGYRFIREEGFWLGAYVINFGVAEGLIGIVMFAYIFVAASNPDVSVWPVVIAGVLAAVVAPILFYRPSRTIWAAIDLTMRPLEPAEEAEAVAWLSANPPAEGRR